MFHGSYNENLDRPGSITAYGDTGNIWGSFLFFSSSPAGFGSVDYELDEAELNIARMFDLKYGSDYEAIEPIVQRLAERLGVSEAQAFDLIVEDDTLADSAVDFDYEEQFAVQLAAAECARALGYDGVELTDENGTVYMVDMLGKEHLLTRV